MIRKGKGTQLLALAGVILALVGIGLAFAMPAGAAVMNCSGSAYCFWNGTSNADTFYGGYGPVVGDWTKTYEGADRLYGYGGNDELRAGPGNDYINGGEGWDECHGGRGTDTFVSCEYINP